MLELIWFFLVVIVAAFLGSALVRFDCAADAVFPRLRTSPYVAHAILSIYQELCGFCKPKQAILRIRILKFVWVLIFIER